LDVTAVVYFLESSGIVTAPESFNQTSEPKTVFRLLILGDRVFPLMDKTFTRGASTGL
jgi:hypothetical protein